MGIERAYREIDRTLHERGAKSDYILLHALRAETAVIDYVVPLDSPNRAETIAVIETVLAKKRGRDRISGFAMELARLALARERRAPAA